MANRRMFSKRVVESARFLKMPSSTQALYFHLGLHADDDGVVEGYNVMRQIGATEDDLKLLVAKGFVTVLNEDLVVFVNDWQENNRIRSDRKVDSIYRDLLISIIPEDKLQTAKPRADTNKLTGRPVDDQWTAQVRLGKDRLGKNKDNSALENAPSDLEAEFEVLWNDYPNKKGKKQAFNHYKAWRKKSVTNTNEYLANKLALYKQDLAKNQWKKPMNGSTWFNGRFDDDLDIEPINKQGGESYGGIEF